MAITGRTGSGKSTLANLILRMYDIESGQIFIDGQAINEISLNSYRSQVGFVPQEVFLFSDTIANNISFGESSLNKLKVEEAAEDAAVYRNIIELIR